MSPNRLRSAVVLLAAFAATHPAVAQTSLNSGGDVFTAANWTNGLPSVGNTGTIAVNGTFSSIFNFNQNTAGVVQVNITAGMLTSTGANFFNGPTDTSTGWATFNWTQSGGTVSFTSNGTLSPNLRTAYTLAGGTITTTGPTVIANIIPYNRGVFHQTGGTVNGLGYEFADGGLSGVRTHALSGGTGTGITRFVVGGSNAAVVDGSFALTFNPATSASVITTSGGGGTGVMNFQDTWTGSWTRDHFATTDWETIFTRTGMQFEGEQITAANYSSIFEVTNAGAAGSSIRLAPVPEPASVLGLVAAVAGAATVWRRWRK